MGDFRGRAVWRGAFAVGATLGSNDARTKSPNFTDKATVRGIKTALQELAIRRIVEVGPVAHRYSDSHRRIGDCIKQAASEIGGGRYARYCDAKDYPVAPLQDGGIHLAGEWNASLARAAQVALEGVISVASPPPARRLDSVDVVCSIFRFAAIRAMRRVPFPRESVSEADRMAPGRSGVATFSRPTRDRGENGDAMYPCLHDGRSRDGVPPGLRDVEELFARTIAGRGPQLSNAAPSPGLSGRRRNDAALIMRKCD